MPPITLSESPKLGDKLGDKLELFPLSPLPVGFTVRHHPRIVRSKRRVKGRYLNDVRKIFGILDPPPLSRIHPTYQ